METVGACAWLIMRGGIEIFRTSVVKPMLTAPASVFYIVWGILYALMGISIARIRRLPGSPEGKQGSNYFIMQLIMNFFWGQIFFNSQAFGLAFVWLLVLLAFLVLMLWDFHRADPAAAWLQIPYLVWVIYLGVQNFNVWFLNR